MRNGLRSRGCFGDREKRQLSTSSRELGSKQTILHQRLQRCPPMAALDELAHLLGEKGRRILVAENPVDLKALGGKNSILVLQLPEGSLAGGGRARGLGYRQSDRLYALQY